MDIRSTHDGASAASVGQPQEHRCSEADAGLARRRVSCAFKKFLGFIPDPAVVDNLADKALEKAAKHFKESQGAWGSFVGTICTRDVIDHLKSPRNRVLFQAPEGSVAELVSPVSHPGARMELWEEIDL